MSEMQVYTVFWNHQKIENGFITHRGPAMQSNILAESIEQAGNLIKALNSNNVEIQNITKLPQVVEYITDSICHKIAMAKSPEYRQKMQNQNKNQDNKMRDHKGDIKISNVQIIEDEPVKVPWYNRFK